MTWLWRICFSLAGAGAALAATVTGSVTLADSRDPGVRKHRRYSGVVVWLEPLNANGPRPAPQRAEMLQKGKAFQPHVIAVPVGSQVEFPNLDPIFHNAFSNFAGQPFDVGLYPPNTSKSVVFRRAGIVRVFCNIHPTMSAVIAVLPTSYFDVTGPSGAYEIAGVPPGEYRLKVFHERAVEARLNELERRVTVGGQRLELPPLVVSETGFLAVPHKNKYGKDYPPVAEDHTVYPGARK